MSEPILAIVIPAWKPDFLADCLRSFAIQSDTGFRVYVGDDASPSDLAAIVGEAGLGDRLIYHRFSENLGARDLVGQWRRCIGLVQDEPWVWLFSDDDLASPDCVAAFRRNLARQPAAVLHRFGLQRIDARGAVLRTLARRRFSSPQDFLDARMREGCESYAIEYVFLRTAYERVGGFEGFDLAWGADDSLWLKLSAERPPSDIPDGIVSWRESDRNISPDQSPKVVVRKAMARLAFLVWLKGAGIVDAESANNRKMFVAWFFGNLRHPVLSIPFLELIRIARRFNALRFASRREALRWTGTLCAVRLVRSLRRRLGSERYR